MLLVRRKEASMMTLANDNDRQLWPLVLSAIVSLEGTLECWNLHFEHGRIFTLRYTISEDHEFGGQGLVVFLPQVKTFTHHLAEA